MLCFGKNLVSQIFMEKRGEGGVSRLSCDFFCLSTETIRRGTLLCFRKILVSKHVKYKRGGGYHNFPSILFGLTVPKHFVEDTFSCSEKIWSRKFLWKREGRGREGVSRFSFESLLSHSTEKVRR